MQGMVPGTMVLTCEPCLAFLRTSSSSYRVDVPGWMPPIGSEGTGRRRAVSRVPTSPDRRDMGSELEVGLRVGLLIGRGHPEMAGARIKRSGRIGGPK